LELAEIPWNHPDNLILSLIHQIQVQNGTFLQSPHNLIKQMNDEIIDFKFQSHPLYPSTVGGDLRAISEYYNINIQVYVKNDRFLFSPTSQSPIFTARLYYNNRNFDSISNILPKHIISDPILTSTIANINLSTWNVRGATDVAKRCLIDYEMDAGNVKIAAIQETHLWSSKLSSTNYSWFLGKMPQGRASRGLGFLVHRNFTPYVNDIQYVTTNIALLIFLLPYMNQPFFFFNVHKCNDGDGNSSIETGKMTLNTLL
jgi:hypothetical protein